MDITLPYIRDAIIYVDDMPGKVPNMRYVDHDVHSEEKFVELAEENYLINTREIGHLGKPILELTQWITRLYNSGILNLLDIPHFGCCKNVRLSVK
jgi:hypothetical protein